MSHADNGETVAVVLDYLPHGRVDDDRPQHEKDHLAHALTLETFRLLELGLTDDADVGIGDRVVVEPADARDEQVRTVRDIEFEELSGNAHSELEYVIEDVVDEQEDRFVGFLNDAEPITLRLHSLNLLTGVGKKLRNRILDERERRPFESFDDVATRVSGFHDPDEVIADRILEELRAEDLKYRLFATRAE
jgi:putative nucleotide binding protein